VAYLTGFLGSNPYLPRFLESDSEHLADIEDGFDKCIQKDEVKGEIEIISFREAKPTYILGFYCIGIVSATTPYISSLLTFSEVVSRNSAGIHTTATKRIEINTDHSGLNKCNQGDELHKQLKKWIEELIPYAIIMPHFHKASLLILQKQLRKKTTPTPDQLWVMNFEKVVHGAAFDEAIDKDDEHKGRCYPNTRMKVLDKIDKWANNKDGEHIFWLYGKAGTGKSTISRTVAATLDEREALGASFFFKRNIKDGTKAKSLFTTIAAQLVRQLPPLAQPVKNAMKDPSIFEKSIEQLFDELVLKPLREVQGKAPLKTMVVVIDALDECDQATDVICQLQKVKLPSIPLKLPPIPLKFFVASRPEYQSPDSFSRIKEKQDLQDCKETTTDICGFLEIQLEKIRKGHPEIRKKHPELGSWPDRTNVQTLLEMAIPLFIFAATACRFIGDPRNGGGEPDDRLETILKYKVKPGLDKTYGPVLDQMLVDVIVPEKRVIKEFKDVVGSIIMLASPLSTVSLARLIGIEHSVVKNRLSLLHSVLNIPNDQENDQKNNKVRLFHQSFRDFLVDPECKEDQFWIDERKTHEKLATRCLQLLSEPDRLEKNICGLQMPGMPRKDISKQTIDRCLPPEVQYACLYWVDHLKGSTGKVQDEDDTHKFLKRHFLHWLEVLSLMGRISESILLIDDLQSITDVSYSPILYASAYSEIIQPKTGIEISKFLHNTKRFILNCRTGIDLVPLQIYSSALVFTPEESLIRKTFRHFVSSWIATQPVIENYWSSCLQTLEGHDHVIGSVAFSPNSEYLASASNDKTVKIWNPATGECLQTLKEHKGPVHSVAFSSNSEHLASKYLASASDDKTVKIWDPATGECLQTLEEHKGPVYSVAFSPNSEHLASKYLASASDDKTVKIWDPATGECLQTLEEHKGPVYSVAFLLNSEYLASKYLASALDDKTIWDPATGECLQTLEGHKGPVCSVAFLLNSEYLASKYLASASDNKTRNPAKEQWLQVLEAHNGSVRSVAFSPNSEYLVLASNDRTVKIWNPATGKCLRMLEGHKGPVHSVAFSPNLKYLASISKDITVEIKDPVNGQAPERYTAWVYKTIKIWNPATGQCLETLEENIKITDQPAKGQWLQALEAHNGSIYLVAFSPNSEYLTSASDNETVKIWNSAKKQWLQALETHNGSIRSVAFSPNSEYLTSVSNDRTIKIWNPVIGQCLQTFKGHNDPVRSITFSPNSEYLTSASDNGTIKIWDLVKRQCLPALEVHNGSVRSVAFSPNSEYLASVSNDRTVKIWNPVTGECLRILKGHKGSVRLVAFSPNSKYLASASNDSTVKIWNPVTGECLRILEGHEGSIYSIAFSPNSEYLASASNDRTIKIWNRATGQCLQTLDGYNNGVHSVTFSPDSKCLAVADSPSIYRCNSTVKIRDLATGQCLRTLDGYDNGVHSVTFSPDSKYLAVAGSPLKHSQSVRNSTVQILDLETKQYLPTLEAYNGSIYSIAFSPNSEYLASASNNKTVKIWNLATGQCLQTLDVRKRIVLKLSFDPTSSSLHTNTGTILLNISTTLNTDSVQTPQQPQYTGYSISSDCV
jgi:WD40 repeat protein